MPKQSPINRDKIDLIQAFLMITVLQQQLKEYQELLKEVTQEVNNNYIPKVSSEGGVLSPFVCG